MLCSHLEGGRQSKPFQNYAKPTGTFACIASKSIRQDSAWLSVICENPLDRSPAGVLAFGMSLSGIRRTSYADNAASQWEPFNSVLTRF